MPGDSAREAISASTAMPKRGSWSNERSSPTVNAARNALSCAVSTPTASSSGSEGSTKAPGNAAT
jgi:hypothetical protein